MHEYGHTKQYEKMGLVDYMSYVGIPSFVANKIEANGNLPYNYYNSPWEYEADVQGGVVDLNKITTISTRQYEAWAEKVNDIYNATTTIAAGISPY